MLMWKYAPLPGVPFGCFVSHDYQRSITAAYCINTFGISCLVKWRVQAENTWCACVIIRLTSANSQRAKAFCNRLLDLLKRFVLCSVWFSAPLFEDKALFIHLMVRRFLFFPSVLVCVCVSRASIHSARTCNVHSFIYSFSAYCKSGLGHTTGTQNAANENLWACYQIGWW